MVLAERVQRVRTLLETLEDPYPRPRGSLRPESGPAASRYVPCDTCKRTGWVRRRRIQVLCLACDGQGWRRRTHGDVEWDSYLVLPVQEAVQLPVEAPHRPPDLPAGEEPPYAWERLRQAYDRRGSYRELRRCLNDLALAHARRRRLIQLVLVEGQPHCLGRSDQVELDLGVVWIALRMRTVRVPPWLLEHEQQQANESIRGLAAQGYTPQQIAARLGLSRETVKRTLRRSRQRRPAEAGRMIGDAAVA